MPNPETLVALVDQNGNFIGASNPVAAGGGMVSTNNSTTTLLTAGSVFTGVGEDVSNYGSISVTVFSDQASNAVSPVIQYSTDNTNWDVSDNSPGYLPTYAGFSYVSVPKGRYARVVYTNGGVNQTVFRLQTIYHSAPIGMPVTVFNAVAGMNIPVRSAGSLTDNFGGGTQPALVVAYRNATNGWDFARNHQDVVLQASTATGTGTVNYDVVNFNGRYLILHANVTAYGAAGSVLLKVQMKDANGLFVDLPNATTGAITSGADILLIVGPSNWPVNASPTFYANVLLPRNFRIVQTVAGNSVTFSDAYSLLA